MRALVLEVPMRDISTFGRGSILDKIELLEVIHVTRLDTTGFSGIFRIRLKDPEDKLENLIGYSGVSRIQLLSDEKDSMIVFWESARESATSDANASEVTIASLPEVRGEIMKFTFVGESRELRKLLNSFDEHGANYRIVSLTDSKFSHNRKGLPYVLTRKQREVISAACESGYYAVPRRITSAELARKLGLDKSTVLEHLRKAEMRLITRIIGKWPGENRLGLNLQDSTPSPLPRSYRYLMQSQILQTPAGWHQGADDSS